MNFFVLFRLLKKVGARFFARSFIYAFYNIANTLALTGLMLGVFSFLRDYKGNIPDYIVLNQHSEFGVSLVLYWYMPLLLIPVVFILADRAKRCELQIMPDIKQDLEEYIETRIALPDDNEIRLSLERFTKAFGVVSRWLVISFTASVRALILICAAALYFPHLVLIAMGCWLCLTVFSNYSHIIAGNTQHYTKDNTYKNMIDHRLRLIAVNRLYSIAVPFILLVLFLLVKFDVVTVQDLNTVLLSAVFLAAASNAMAEVEKARVHFWKKVRGQESIYLGLFALNESWLTLFKQHSSATDLIEDE